jgi:hypothetical protein
MHDLSLSRPHFVELVADILGKDEVLRFRAHGGSMHPFIKNGDIIEIKPTEASAVRLGDVILYHSAGGRLLAHRVIELGTQRGQVALVTKGDAASGPDQLVHPEQVLGQVVAIERGRRKTRLDKGVYQLINILWARLSPHSSWFYLIFGKAKRRVCKIRST